MSARVLLSLLVSTAALSAPASAVTSTSEVRPSPGEAPGRVSVELGVGAWWVESAAAHAVALATAEAALVWEGRETPVRADLRYRIGFEKEGLTDVGYAGTTQALEARIHWVYRWPAFALTLGLGPAATLTTGRFTFNGATTRVSSEMEWGLAGAVGLELNVGRVPLRVELGAASQGLHVEGLASVSFALPFRR